MTSTLIDSNVLIDIFGPPQHYRDWSIDAVTGQRAVGKLLINHVIFSELASIFAFQSLLQALETMEVSVEHIGLEAAWHAGIAHGAYRRAGGSRERTLPDFFIGAQAAKAKHTLLTRDPARYQTYFPGLRIISPNGQS